jgi:SecD/SecF fusion protein
MKTIKWLIIFVFPIILLAAGCSSKQNYNLRMTIEPEDKTDLYLSNTLPDAAEIIKNRIVSFGIPDKNISMVVSSDRITMVINKIDTSAVPIIENLATLPGRLGFWETYENKDVIPFLNDANRKLAEMKVIVNFEESSGPKADSAQTEPSLMDFLEPEAAAAEDSARKAFMMENPLFGILAPMVNSDGQPMPSCLIGLVNAKDTSMVNELLRMEEISNLFPRDMKFYWSRYPYEYDETKSFYELHAIKVSQIDGNAPLTGEVIVSAEAKPAGSDVLLRFAMNAEGAKIWSRMTRDNIDRCIAVIIDDRVRSYPRVMNEITSGNTEITGDFTMAEAKYLSFLLNSGRNGLPVNLRITEKIILEPQ